MGENIPHKWKAKESWNKEFKTKTVINIRDKEGHYIMIKGSIQDEITIIIIYVPNTGGPQY